MFSFFGTFAQTTSIKQTVLLYATVQESPAKITLKWPAESGITKYSIYKKPKNASSWGAEYANVPGTDTSFTDINVSLGQDFEYAIYKLVGTNTTSLGYIWAGVSVPVKDYRGSIILLVDNNYVKTLANEIKQLETDMIGDGWQVIRHNISRTQTTTSVRNIIINDYNSNPDLTAVFLLGRIPVPYSGLLSLPPDGHIVGQGNHTGAWPADAYYAEINGAWTDWDTDTTGYRAENQNRIGDGKWDQNVIPSYVELQVGRVDLYNMPGFSPNDTFLVKRYLQKDHDFKTGKIIANPRGLIDDNFTNLNLTAQAWRGFANMFGPRNINSTGDYFTVMRDSSYLWSCGAGAGSFNSCNGIGTSSNFMQDSLRNIFTMLTGSFFGDWDNSNNLLRSPLASKGTTLVSFWGGIPQWQLQHLALGENIGYCTKITMNNDIYYFTGNFNGSTREIHIALMGDPTLRIHVVKPVSNFNATPISANTRVSLGWSASNETVEGYNIYRARTLYGKFTKLNNSLLTGTSFIDTFPWNGTNVYMVRAVKLETSASGTYYNMSIGAFDSTNAVNNSINELITDNIKVNIYPNPNHGKFKIQTESSSPEVLYCEILNPLGKIIYQQNYSVSTGLSSKEIDLGIIDKGIYLLKITGKHTQIAKQIVIQ